MPQWLRCGRSAAASNWLATSAYFTNLCKSIASCRGPPGTIVFDEEPRTTSIAIALAVGLSTFAALASVTGRSAADAAPGDENCTMCHLGSALNSGAGS